MPAGAPSLAVPAAPRAHWLTSLKEKQNRRWGFHPATTFSYGWNSKFVHFHTAAHCGKKGYWFATSQGFNRVATVQASFEVLLHGEMNAHYAPEASA
jgi:hypothetical protein